MSKAFVLITAEPGSEDAVLKDLKKIEGVDETYFSYGVYDIIAKIRGESIDKLKELVTQRIRRLNKVRSTLTMMIIEEAK
jgi:DNA-binding Lrp family transcriptional regulator